MNFMARQLLRLYVAQHFKHNVLDKNNKIFVSSKVRWNTHCHDVQRFILRIVGFDNAEDTILPEKLPLQSQSIV